MHVFYILISHSYVEDIPGSFIPVISLFKLLFIIIIIITKIREQPKPDHLFANIDELVDCVCSITKNSKQTFLILSYFYI